MNNTGTPDTGTGTVKKYGRPWYRLSKAARRRILHEESVARFQAREGFFDKHLVYFLRDAGSGAIKIGIAREPGRRLTSLQTAHAYKLEILGTCQGGHTLERVLHMEFEADRLMGEWFKPSDRLTARINDLCPTIPSESGVSP